MVCGVTLVVFALASDRGAFALTAVLAVVLGEPAVDATTLDFLVFAAFGFCVLAFPNLPFANLLFANLLFASLLDAAFFWAGVVRPTAFVFFTSFA